MFSSVRTLHIRKKASSMVPDQMRTSSTIFSMSTIPGLSGVADRMSSVLLVYPSPAGPIPCGTLLYRKAPHSVMKEVFSLPFPAIPANRKRLEDWILQYYSPGAFNICKRQPMPSTAGPPMKIFVDPGATPVRCTKPIPVPLHFGAQVKADLLADEKRGVIERVPLGIRPTWM